MYPNGDYFFDHMSYVLPALSARPSDNQVGQLQGEYHGAQHLQHLRTLLTLLTWGRGHVASLYTWSATPNTHPTFR